MATEEQKAKRAAKRGAVKTAEADRVAQDAAGWMRGQEQLALLELVGGGDLLPDDDKAMAAPAGGKGGRPVGARAIAPLEYRRYILATKGDFLGRFASLAMVDTLALARLLGCKPIEALTLQQKLGATAAPYVYTPQKAPLDDKDREYFAGLVFMAGAAAVPGSPAGKGMLDAVAALAGRPPDLEEIRALGDVKFVASEPAHSEPAIEDEEKAP